MSIYNDEHYPDPTASAAIDAASADERAIQLICEIRQLIQDRGFVLHNRIAITDRRTGRTYK